MMVFWVRGIGLVKGQFVDIEQTDLRAVPGSHREQSVSMLVRDQMGGAYT